MERGESETDRQTDRERARGEYGQFEGGSTKPTYITWDPNAGIGRSHPGSDLKSDRENLATATIP